MFPSFCFIFTYYSPLPSIFHRHYTNLLQSFYCSVSIVFIFGSQPFYQPLLLSSLLFRSIIDISFKYVLLSHCPTCLSLDDLVSLACLNSYVFQYIEPFMQLRFVFRYPLSPSIASSPLLHPPSLFQDPRWRDDHEGLTQTCDNQRPPLSPRQLSTRHLCS